MANYKGIVGQEIEIKDSNPDNPIIGQVWYNRTDDVLKYKAPTSAGSWATGGNVNTARQSAGGFGLQSASILCGGKIGLSQTNQTESYNGSSWSEVNDFPQGKDKFGSAGIQSAGLTFGGLQPGDDNQVASWNGTSWSETTDMNTAKYYNVGAGTQTSALSFSGILNPGGSRTNQTESWNGSAWNEVADQNTARSEASSSGASNTDALLFMGTSPTVALTESWNGSAWSEVADMNTAGQRGSGCGTSTLALAMGRTAPSLSPTLSGRTEEWNGTAWTEVADLSTARENTAGSGTQLAGLCTSGGTGSAFGNSNATEEFTKIEGTKTIATT